jgi:YfiH family protein
MGKKQPMIGQAIDLHALFGLPDVGVRALCSSRSGGLSRAPFASLNLADHVGDDPECVETNRKWLKEGWHLPSEPRWLNQIHGNTVLEVTRDNRAAVSQPADAASTMELGLVLAVLTADCLPVLLSTVDGAIVAAVHAGWRGIVGGVLEASVAKFKGREAVAWVGPGIGPCHFEVGPEFRDFFPDGVFHRGQRPQHDYLDLTQLAETRLKAAGVAHVVQSNLCTACNLDLFYSYRREGQTGRFATLIWRRHNP